MKKKLWAPWRVEYILAEKEDGCLFCRKARAEDDEKEQIVFRGPETFVLLNRFPYNSGHLLVAPYRHTAELDELTPEESADLMASIGKCVSALKAAMAPEGFNVGFNLGKPAGAGVLEHLHAHIVPRWEGDTNCMPVISDTKVVPQSLQATYELLVESWPSVASRK